jgi:hypothetical protein
MKNKDQVAIFESYRDDILNKFKQPDRLYSSDFKTVHRRLGQKNFNRA